MDDLKNIIAGNIIELRKTANITQAELATKLNYTDKAVSKWESGRGLPDISLLEPLGKALGVSVAELLSGECVLNRNRSGNLFKSRFYVCPVCGKSYAPWAKARFPAAV